MIARRRLMGFALIVLGFAVALPFGVMVAMDVSFDSPGTWRRHLNQLGLVGAGVVVAAYGARQARTGTSPVSGIRLAGGVLLLLLTVPATFYFIFLCEIGGCGNGGFYLGSVVIALVGAAGVLLAVTNRRAD